MTEFGLTFRRVGDGLLEYRQANIWARSAARAVERLRERIPDASVIDVWEGMCVCGDPDAVFEVKGIRE